MPDKQISYRKPPEGLDVKLVINGVPYDLVRLNKLTMESKMDFTGTGKHTDVSRVMLICEMERMDTYMCSYGFGMPMMARRSIELTQEKVKELEPIEEPKDEAAKKDETAKEA